MCSPPLLIDTYVDEKKGIYCENLVEFVEVKLIKYVEAVWSV